MASDASDDGPPPAKKSYFLPELFEFKPATKFFYSKLQKLRHISLDYNIETDEFRLCLQRFDFRTEKGENYDVFLQFCRENSVRQLRYYYGAKPYEHFAYSQSQGRYTRTTTTPAFDDVPFLLALSSNNSQNLCVLKCEKVFWNETVWPEHKIRALRLVCDENLSSVRLYVTSLAFSEDPYGQSIPSMIAGSTSSVMEILMADSNKKIVDKNSKIKRDNAHNFYVELKAAQEKFRDDFSTSSDYDLRCVDLIPRLRPYQRQAVRWLLFREKYGSKMSENTTEFEDDSHPLFVKIFDIYDVEKSKPFFYNFAGGYFVSSEPPKPKPTLGGILAEEMGLGKTVEILTLILLNRKEPKMSTQMSKNLPQNSKDEVEITSSDATCLKETDEAFKKKSLLEKRHKLQKSQKIKTKIDRGKKKKKGRKNKDEENSEESEEEIDRPQKHCAKPAQCFCGRSILKDASMKGIQCPKCGRYQHMDCVGWKEDKSWAVEENYLCPKCLCASPSNAIDSKTTLIISPATISDQWYAEIRKHVRDQGLTVYLYSGVHAGGFVQPLELAQHDVVIAAYETLKIELDYVEAQSRIAQCLRKPNRFPTPPSPLTAVNWWRLCLDEAQMVEGTTTKAATMCLKLTAKYKWCVTGTPIQTSLDDLYGLFLLLDVDYFSIRNFWLNALYSPYVEGVDKKFVEIMAPILWRTSKADVLDQLGIPEQKEKVHYLDFGAIEMHYYQRLRTECATEFGDIIAQMQLDLITPLDDLERYRIEGLLRPLLQLRRACSHPQLVQHGQWHLIQRRAGQRVSFDRTQQVIPMNKVLEQMIEKTQTECEDTHRAIISNLNGLAGLEILKKDFDAAASYYREALRSIKFYEADAENTKNGPVDTKKPVRTDALQKIHIIQNLHWLTESQELETDESLDKNLLMSDCDALKKQYLSKTGEILENVRKELNAHPADSRDFTKVTWFADIVEILSKDQEESAIFIERVLDHLVDAKIATLFRDAKGFLHIVTKHHDDLLSARASLSTGVSDLLDELDSKPIAVLSEAVPCHLNQRQNVSASKCIICRLDTVFDKYESKLFNFDDNISMDDDSKNENEPDFAADVNFLNPGRRGTWASSGVERALRFIYGYANRAERRPLFENDQLIFEEARETLKMFDQMKAEFRLMRAVSVAVRDHVARQDELNMAVQRLENLSDQQIVTMGWEFKSGNNQNGPKLKRQTGHLRYLENLREQHRRKYEGETSTKNTDECPVCKNELGVSWRVLTCGHSYCERCLEYLSKNLFQNGRHITCPTCRFRTEKSHIVDVVFEDDRRRGEEKKDVRRVRGDCSTKIEGVLKCLMEIQVEDPAAKSLVFSNWTEMLDLLAKALELNEMKFQALQKMTGGNEKWRQALTRFKTSRECRILLIPLNSGANGLNIVEATHVLLVDQSLNPAREQQAIGRVHRIGQRHRTTVHRFVIKSTVEEKIHRALNDITSKRAEAALDDSFSDVPLTVGELMEILEDREVQEEVTWRIEKMPKTPGDRTPVSDGFCRLFTYPLVRHSDMPEMMRRDVLHLCVQACEKFADNNQEAARMIKERMDKKHGQSWHVLVGEQFGFEITHETGSLLYLFCGGNLAVCVWKCN